jgi:hypothetical protein
MFLTAGFYFSAERLVVSMNGWEKTIGRKAQS